MGPSGRYGLYDKLRNRLIVLGVFLGVKVYAIAPVMREWLDLDQYRRRARGRSPSLMKTDDLQMSPRFRQLCSKFSHDCDERLSLVDQSYHLR